MNPGRAASLARRRAQSSRGKAGMSANGMTAAQTARAANPELSGRELAKALREQRSRRGGAGQKKSAPTGRSRAARNPTAPGAAKDAPWKVGASETAQGRTLTGTQVGRSRDVTGDEASTCRTITGTEYLGADIFRDFCQTESAKTPSRGSLSPTTGGNAVSGNQVGRSTRVTGDEPGTCKKVTGTQYMGADLQEAFCGVQPEPAPAKVAKSETRGGKSVTGADIGRSNRVTGGEVGADRTLTGTQYTELGSIGSDRKAAPPKVGNSATLSGSHLTGTMIGRHPSMTGDETGSCRNVTGDDYIGLEQYGQFCDSAPARTERKVGVSATLGGERVTGTMTGRARRVTGDEPGTCKSITGTPYAGAEQYGDYCDPAETGRASARMRPHKRMFGSVMTGIQPAVGGRTTGDEAGACEPVTGTPYLGADQAAEVCAAMPAEPGSPDFPQPLPGAAEAEPWENFSVDPPAHAARAPQKISGVTGSTYEKGQITGPFGMASGKVTGTEEARFGGRGKHPVEDAPPVEQPTIDGRVKSRITGEGIDTGAKITGDDWDRGDRVTGTEGTSALARNPSRRGRMAPMAAAMAQGRPEKEKAPEPVSKVTGGSGNTDKGALITYSGGARG
ncbi:carboxysome shell protein CsoS2 [Imhoffiella purpurea]|uniref:Carboxysome shell protein CsoS2 n=2 Tax=Imhoffiella purpurea TaxID=1249627 RepID=W9VGM3_9GAMM|nr:carboxysome shell protein CsoS2 [Imhoffiella purpurea]